LERRWEFESALSGRTVSALFKKYSQKKRTKRVDTARVGAANPAKLSAFRKSELVEQQAHRIPPRRKRRSASSSTGPELSENRLERWAGFGGSGLIAAMLDRI
jgi:hypothetical protein